MSMARRVFITVGEISGDRHAANLVRKLKELDPEITIEGLGGDAMRQAGATIHHDTVRGAAMGLRALLRAGEVRRLLAWTRDYYRRTPPDLHVCVDSWSMNWHFARLAKQAGRPVLYYIAPQAWASRPGRVKRLRQFVDRLACILPFEQDWFNSRGVPAVFVGHPLFDQLVRTPPPPPKTAADGWVVGLVPGSRRGIARANIEPLLSVAAAIRRQFPNSSFVIPTTANTDQIVRDALAQSGLTAVIKQDAFDELIPACDLCLTVSGTATLHIAAHNVPMLVVYRGSWLLWNLLGRWIISARTYALVNILSGHDKHIVPEFIPWYGSTDTVAHAAVEYLKYPQKMAEQRRLLAEMIAPLAAPGASRKVAELAFELMDSKNVDRAGG